MRTFYNELFKNGTYGLWVDNDGRILKVINLFRQWISIPGTRGLEIGCGAGDITMKISQDARVRFYIATDLDLYRGFLSQNPKFLASKNKQFVVCDVGHLPFLQNVFDWIIFSEVIEHLNKNMQEPAIVELSSVLKPKGILLISTPNPRSFAVLVNKVHSTFGIKTPTYKGQPLESWVSPYKLDELLNSAGFKILYRCGTYYLSEHFSWLPKKIHLTLSAFMDKLLSDRLRDRGSYQYRITYKIPLPHSYKL